MPDASKDSWFTKHRDSLIPISVAMLFVVTFLSLVEPEKLDTPPGNEVKPSATILPTPGISPVSTQVSTADLRSETKVAYGQKEIPEEVIVYDIAAICSGYMAQAEQLSSCAEEASRVAGFQYWEAATQMQPDSYQAWKGYTSNLGTYFISEFASDVKERPRFYTLEKFLYGATRLTELAPGHYYGYFCLAYAHAYCGDVEQANINLNKVLETKGAQDFADEEWLNEWRDYFAYAAQRANKVPYDWIDLDRIQEECGAVSLQLREKY